MDLTQEQIKELFFEIYAAGFEAGYSHEVDIQTAYNKFWNEIQTDITKGFKQNA